jgi:antitoxin component YwqK of YwqJK toxin-antitoxin module
MKESLTLLFIILHIMCFGQNKYKVDQTTLHLTDTIVYLRITMKPITGEIYEEYEFCDMEKFHLTLEQKKLSDWITNGCLLKKLNYKDGLKDGLQRKWWEDGILYSEENYKNGLKDGLQRLWGLSGILTLEENYKNGVLDGVQKRWWDTQGQQLWYEEIYNNGKIIDGIVKNWWDDGSLWIEFNYKDGKLNGLSKVYYRNGKLRSEEIYKNGKLDGLWKGWYENGIISFERVYSDGKIISEKCWNENGMICNCSN